MCLLGLDIGEKRIGIAISQSGLLAAPHSVLQRKSKQEDFARLGRLIADLKVERVIVGMPYSLSHPERLGPQARRVRRYAQALAQTLTIPLEFVDESYSTVEAQDFLALSGQKKVPLDAAAAAIILQTYIARQPHG